MARNRLPRYLPSRRLALCLGCLAVACLLAAGIPQVTGGPHASTQPPPLMASAAVAPRGTVQPAAVAPMPTTQPSGERRGFNAEVIHPRDAGLVEVRRTDTGERVRVRLIGLAAPTKATRDEPGQEPWGTRGQQFLSLAITRKIVRVELDVATREEGSQTLWGYIWLGDQLINESVLAAGWATLETRPPNIAHVERLQLAQRSARENGRGVWNPEQPLTESLADFRQRIAKEAAEKVKRAAELKLAVWEPGCVVGNARTLRFHAPGDRYYDSARRSSHAVFYRSAQDAESAGLIRAAQ